MGTKKRVARESGWNKWIVGTVLVMWIVLSALAFNVFLAINAVLGVAAVVFLFVKKLRVKLPQQLNSLMRLMAVVGISAVGFCASNTAKNSAIASEQSAHYKKKLAIERRDMRYRAVQKTLADLSAKVSKDPVAVYQALSNILASDGDLQKHSKISVLRKTVDDLKEKTVKPYAAHAYEQAKLLFKAKKLKEARRTVMAAQRLDATLPSIREFADKISDAIAHDAARQSAEYLRGATKETIRAAKKRISRKEFISASGLLSLRLTDINDHEKKHGALVSLSAQEKRLRKLHKSIAPKVKRQQQREARRQKEREELLAYCGRPPKRSEWNGGIIGIKLHVMRSAHDPDSIEVTNCTMPVLKKKSCWVTACDVRGTNGFGAKVLNRKTFSLERGITDKDRYIVHGGR